VRLSRRRRWRAIPFGTFTWTENDDGWDWNLDEEPAVLLRQEDADSFVLLQSFCYLVPDGHQDAGDVYVVPGEDGPDLFDTERVSRDGHAVLIPPNLKAGDPDAKKGETDLASVPWFMWWLIATYGNHTRAALLHDSLYVDEGEPPVPRPDADRLLLMALREPGQAAGVFRHWLMWAAVSAFGAMGKKKGAVFGAHVYAVWLLLVAAIAWAWGTEIWSWGPVLWPDEWDVPVVPAELANAAVVGLGVLAVIGLLAFVLGGTWRAGRDNTGGWTYALVVMVAIIGVLIWLERPWTLALEWSPLNLLLAALVLLLLGLVWGLAAHRSLRGWLWPTALIGLPIALFPVGLIFVSVYLVRLIDEGAARVRATQTDEQGQPLVYKKPDIKPTRAPL
jgi:uncharacterized protein DUF1353